MVTGTLIKCSRESDRHSGPLRKINGEWVCQECWARENNIKPREPKGRPVICPDCGEILMTRYRGGKISISSISMQGNKATLKCGCGYEKKVDNPFGRRQNRDGAAFAKLRAESHKRNKEDKNAGQQEK